MKKVFLFVLFYFILSQAFVSAQKKGIYAYKDEHGNIIEKLNWLPPVKQHYINLAIYNYGITLPTGNILWGFIINKGVMPGKILTGACGIRKNGTKLIFIGWDALENYCTGGDGLIDENLLVLMVGISLLHELDHFAQGNVGNKKAKTLAEKKAELEKHRPMINAVGNQLCGLIELAKSKGDEKTAEKLCKMYKNLKASCDATDSKIPASWNIPPFPECPPCD